MTTTNESYTRQDWTGRLSPADVHHVLFTRAGLGRRGYDELEVDGFLERVQQELTRLISEKADLRDEVARLKSQLAQSGSAAPAADGGLSKDEANLQAVRLLAAAQQTADVYVADAEKYSQRLTIDAREHSEAMLDEARKAAQRMVEEAERLARSQASRTIEGERADAPVPSKAELDQQVAYLKTFGQVVRVQLKAYLEALLRDVEDEWGKADPGVVDHDRPITPPRAAPQAVELGASQGALESSGPRVLGGGAAPTHGDADTEVPEAPAGPDAEASVSEHADAARNGRGPNTPGKRARTLQAQ